MIDEVDGWGTEHPYGMFIIGLMIGFIAIFFLYCQLWDCEYTCPPPEDCPDCIPPPCPTCLYDASAEGCIGQCPVPDSWAALGFVGECMQIDEYKCACKYYKD